MDLEAFVDTVSPVYLVPYVYMDHLVTLEFVSTGRSMRSGGGLHGVLRLQDGVVRAALCRGRLGAWRGASAQLGLRALPIFDVIRFTPLRIA